MTPKDMGPVLAEVDLDIEDLDALASAVQHQIHDVEIRLANAEKFGTLNPTMPDDIFISFLEGELAMMWDLHRRLMGVLGQVVEDMGDDEAEEFGY